MLSSHNTISFISVYLAEHWLDTNQEKVNTKHYYVNALHEMATLTHFNLLTYLSRLHIAYKNPPSLSDCDVCNSSSFLVVLETPKEQ